MEQDTTLPAGLGRDRRQPPGGRTGGLVEQVPVDPLVAGGEHGDVAPSATSPMLLERMASGELKTAHLATHSMPLDERPHVDDLFKNKKDGCGRPVFRPDPEIARMIPCVDGSAAAP